MSTWPKSTLDASSRTGSPAYLSLSDGQVTCCSLVGSRFLLCHALPHAAGQVTWCLQQKHENPTKRSMGLTTWHPACSATRQRKGVAAALAEKKIAILQRGLEFHPGSDQLLLALLNEVCCFTSVRTVPLSMSADFRQGQLHTAEVNAHFAAIG